MAEKTYQSRYETSHALVIGIDRYETLPPLQTAVRGAEAMAYHLEMLGFVVTVLRDEQATRENILRVLNVDYARADPDDRVLVYFAGHGVTRRTTTGSPVGLIMPHGVLPGQFHQAIEMDTLVDSSKFIPAKHILYVLDACFGGLAITRAAPGDRLVSDLLRRRAVQAIAAGQEDQMVADLWGPENHSIFTGLLLDHLSRRTGLLTANELGLQLQREVGRYTKSRQTPHYGHLLGSGSGDFVFWSDEEGEGVDLPKELRAAIESSLSGIREGAVRELEALVRSSSPELARLAREALERLSEDDSRRVSYAAREALGLGPTLTQQGSAPVFTPSGPPIARAEPAQEKPRPEPAPPQKMAVAPAVDQPTQPYPIHVAAAAPREKPRRRWRWFPSLLLLLSVMTVFARVFETSIITLAFAGTGLAALASFAYFLRGHWARGLFTLAGSVLWFVVGSLLYMDYWDVWMIQGPTHVMLLLWSFIPAKVRRKKQRQ